MKKSPFFDEYCNLIEKVKTAINSYDGPGIITLPTGEEAIDNNDSWLIIHQADNNPHLIDKKQYASLTKKGQAPCDEIMWVDDYYPLDDLCAMADNLYEKGVLW